MWFLSTFLCLRFIREFDFELSGFCQLFSAKPAQEWPPSKRPFPLSTDSVSDSGEEDKGEKAAAGAEKGQTIKHWLSKLSELRREVDSLRASLCNQYAEDMGQNIQCATQ